METSPLIRCAWDLSWKYKSLWVFGLFLEGLWTIQSSWREAQQEGGALSEIIGSGVLLPLMLAGAVVWLIFGVMAVISSGALVDAVNKLTRGGVFKWGSSFSVGIDFFWRMLGIFLLYFGSLLALVLVLALPVVLLFWLHTALGVLALLVIVPVLFLGIFAIVTIFSLAQRAVVVRNASVGDALEEGYLLLKFQPWSCAKIFIVFILLYLLTGMLALVLISIVAAPFIAMAIATSTGLVMALAVGLPLVLLIMIVLDGLFGTFYHSLYTLFYFALLEPATAPQTGFTGQPVA